MVPQGTESSSCIFRSRVRGVCPVPKDLQALEGPALNVSRCLKTLNFSAWRCFSNPWDLRSVNSLTAMKTCCTRPSQEGEEEAWSHFHLSSSGASWDGALAGSQSFQPTLPHPPIPFHPYQSFLVYCPFWLRLLYRKKERCTSCLWESSSSPTMTTSACSPIL